MADQTLDYAPNYNHVIELDITPEQTYRTWAYALVGATNCDPSLNETTSDETYYHNLGATETEITAVSDAIAITSHRKYGDPCQDFIAGLAHKIGKQRKTNYRWTQPDGTYMEGTCTISGIKTGMGAPNDKGDFQFTISVNTIDEFSSPGKNLLPTAISCSPANPTVAVGSTTELTVTVTPSGANQKCHYGIEDTSIATVDADGVISGVAQGSTKLTIKAASLPSVVKQVNISVGASGSDVPSVTVSPSRSSVNVGSTKKLTATPVPSNASVSWSSSDTDKATVSDSGVVTGVAAGTVTITATITVDGNDYTDTCSMTVNA